MQRIGRKVWTTVAIVTAVALGGAGVAYADNVIDDVVDGGSDTFVAGGSTTITYYIQATGGDGCNASTTTPVTITPNVSAPVTTSGPITFTSCGNSDPHLRTITYSSNTPGNYPLTVSASHSSYNTNPSKATLIVTVNTPPTVSVTGVTDGASYVKGSVPTAGCSVTDTEDIGESTAPVLSAISGPNAANGIGMQTATCSYTDRGGLYASASATYTITAPPPPPNTAPVVVVTGVTDGGTYAESSVPAAGCSVTDTQDGPSTFAAALSAITGPDAAGGIGFQTATCDATDNGGLSATPATATYTITDATAPTISSATSPIAPNGDNGWFTSNVGLTWTVSEPDSTTTLVKTGCVNQNISADQAATTYPCSATSAGGSAPQQTVSIQRDATAPTISAVATTPTGSYTAGTFSNVPVTVTFTCGDALSGVAECPVPVVINSDTAGTPVSGTARDNAGNRASSAPIDVKFDGTRPTITASASTLSGTPYTSGTFTNETVTVTFTCGDGLSGVQSCPADVVISNDTDADGDSVVRTATDNAGNSTLSTPIIVKVDKVKPTIVASASTPPGQQYTGGFTNKDVTVAFDCADLLSGLATCSLSNVISADTPLAGTDVTGTATDNAGNTQTSNPINVKVDKTAPTITASASTPTGPYTGGFTNQPVTVTFSCADILSGVRVCPANHVVSAETTVDGVTVVGVGSDNAGNVTTSTAIVVRIDTTRPDVTIIGGPAAQSYFLNLLPGAPTCSATDALSGVAGSCSMSGYSNAVGTHLLTATATDNAGNVGTATRSYTVRPNLIFGGFFQPVDTGDVLNVVKGGSTVPLKFTVADETGNQTVTSVVKSFTATPASCAGGGADDVEITTTGNTTLRYDATAGQFIQNWKTPTGAGTCYRATVTTTDGIAHSAMFKLK